MSCSKADLGILTLAGGEFVARKIWLVSAIHDASIEMAGALCCTQGLVRMKPNTYSDAQSVSAATYKVSVF